MIILIWHLHSSYQYGRKLKLLIGWEINPTITQTYSQLYTGRVRCVTLQIIDEYVESLIYFVPYEKKIN